ncbi:MAG: hypothetical protein AB1435_11655 [Chloroflexota bacterium]|jgi:hypothetical protein
MSSTLNDILWEDLVNAQRQLRKCLDSLQTLQGAVEDGRLDDPTRLDSNRLNHLLVLAELLYAEIQPWVDERVGVRRNGHQPANGARATTATV